MTLHGTIHIDDPGTSREAVLVRYQTTYDSEPTFQVCFWKVERIVRNPYAIGAYPKQGDAVTSTHDGWSGPGYTLHMPGNVEALRVERGPVPCPKVRKGTETRWHFGRWEKLTKKGWVAA